MGLPQLWKGEEGGRRREGLPQLWKGGERSVGVLLTVLKALARANVNPMDPKDMSTATSLSGANCTNP